MPRWAVSSACRPTCGVHIPAADAQGLVPAGVARLGYRMQPGDRRGGPSAQETRREELAGGVEEVVFTAPLHALPIKGLALPVVRSATAAGVPQRM